MAEIGVLELKIKDSSSDAGKGLRELAGALADVQKAVANGLKMSNVSRSLSSFSKSVSENSKALTSVGTFLNAITNYSRAFKETENLKFNAQPIKDLKEAIGDGIKIGQAGTQINNIRTALEGKWNTENAYQAGIALSAIGEGARSLGGAGLGTKAKDLSAIAKALDEYVQSSQKAVQLFGQGKGMNTQDYIEGQVSSAVSSADMVRAGANVGLGIQIGMESTISGVAETSSEIAGTIVETVNTELDEHSPSRVMMESGRNAGIGLAEGLLQSKSEIQTASEEVADTIKQAFYSSFNVMSIMDTPLEHLRDIFRTPTKSAKDYANAVGAVLPKVQKMSSEEMMLATHLKFSDKAVEATERLFNGLNTPIDYTHIQDYVDMITGVSRQFNESAGESATVLNLPALDQNGPFKYATEEVEHYSQILQHAREEMDFWDRKYTETQKQIKYRGESDERTSMLNTAEAGFNQALQQMEEAERRLSEINNSISSGQTDEASRISEVNTALEDQIRIRKELLEIENQQRLANNYPAYRELFMSGEGGWDKQVPEMYGLTAKSIQESETYADALKMTMQEVNEYVDQFVEKMNVPSGPLLRDTIDQAFEAKLSFKSASESAEILKKTPLIADNLKRVEAAASGMTNRVGSAMGSYDAQLARTYSNVDNMVNSMSRIDLMTMKLDGMKQALAEDIAQGKVDTQNTADRVLAIQNLQNQINDLKSAEEEAAKSTGSLAGAWNSIKDVVKGSWVGQLAKQFWNLGKRMAIRALIRGISKAFKEGTNNVREYSKAIGSSFSADMDKMAATMNTLKNSVGAAVAPAIQAAIPILNAVANAAIYAFNWVNQLISLLTGRSSWTKATEGANDFAEAAKGAGGAASEWLAAWDELNVMNSGGGGGGGGAGAAQYAEMFEEVYAFDSKIREIAEFLRENAEGIKAAAIETGIAIAAWKLGSAFAQTLPMLSQIFGLVGTAATIALTVTLDWMLMNQYLDTGDEGWLWTSILTTAVGSTAAFAIAKKLIGGSAGSYAAGVTLILTAATDIIANIQHTDVSALSEKSIKTNIKAAIEGAAGIGFIAKAAGATMLGTLTAAAGGGLVIFGVATALKVMTSKDNVSWDSAETIKGAIVASVPVGFGLFLLGAGGLAAGIAAALTFGVVIAVKAFMPKDKITWGTFNLTDEEVQAFVDNEMFNVNVRAVVSLITEAVDIQQNQRQKIGTDLEAMLDTYNVIKLGLANDQDYATMKQQVDTIIDDIGLYIQGAKDLGKLTLKYTPTLAGDNDTETGEWFTGYNQGWDTIEKFVKDKGKIIGDWLTSQESKAIKDATPDVVAAAMEQLAAVTEAIAEAKLKGEQFAAFNLSLGDLDEQSFESVLTKFREYEENLRTEYNKLVQEQYTHQAELVEALKITLGPDYENNPEYQKALDDLHKMGQRMHQAVEEGVNSASEPGKNMIMEWLKKQFAGSFDMGDGIITAEDYWNDVFRDFDASSFEDIQNVLRKILEENLTEPYQIEVADLVGFTGWDLLSDEMKSEFLAHLQITPEMVEQLAKIGITPEDLVTFGGGWDVFSEEVKKKVIQSVTVDASILKKIKEFDVPAEEVVNLVGWDWIKKEGQTQFIIAMTEAYGSSGIAAIKSQIPNIKAGDIIKIVDWSAFTLKQKLEFVVAIGKAFGSAEAISAARNSGINIGDLVQEGMQSKDASIRAAAEEWNRLIDAETSKMHEIYAEFKKGLPQELATTLKNTIEAQPAIINKITAAFAAGYPDNLAAIINAIKANVTPGANTATVIKQVQDAFASLGIELNLSVNDNQVASLKQKIKNAMKVKAAMKDNSGNVLYEAIMEPYAQGGFVTSGDIFMANENGHPELIGSFGSRTAVANTDQIVEGISRGVASANAEQNALLIQQNNLLMALLRKDASVRINASAALGRVARQSIDMYNGMSGG